MFTDELITNVRDLAQVPDNDEDITDEFILNQAYLGLLERFTHPVIMLRNGSWLHSYTFTTTAGVSRYRIPSRSIAQGLEKIECAMMQGQSNSNASQWYLLNVQTNIQATDYEGINYTGRPAAFTYISDSVDIYPTPSANWTLRVWYYLRPTQLVTSDEYISDFGAQIVAVNTIGTGLYRLTLDSAIFNGLDNGGHLYDIQFTTGNCEWLAVDVLGSYPSLPNQLEVFLTDNEVALLRQSRTNYLSSSYDAIINPATSPTFVVPLPQELCNALVSYVGAVVLAEKGDSEKAQVFSQKAELAIKNLVDVQIPRSKGQPSVFKTRNSYLRRRIGRWGFGGTQF
jgi:hypothetical protein